MFQKRMVVFDLDGTLADSSGDLICAANTALAGSGLSARLDPVADRRIAMRGGRAMLARALGAGHPAVEALYPALLRAYGAALDRHSQLFPGVRATLETLRAGGYPLAVCTNKPEALALRLLASLQVLPLFDAVIGADTLPTRKPDPAPLRAAVQRGGGRWPHAVLIGDTQTDRDTARAAGLPCILVPFGAEANVAALCPDAILESFDALPALLARMDAG